MSIRYEARGQSVVMLMGRDETCTVATCFNESWAEVVAGLLQADWEQDIIASAAKAKVL
jgi:hypothetical protein